MKPFLLRFPVGFLFLALSSSALAQGSLTPSGPPEETMRSLDQIEPRTPIVSVPLTLTQPGSYYLTGHLHHGGTGAAIEITASDVTLDLNGFALTGNPSSGPLIAVAGSQANVRIRRGNLGFSGEDGVSALAVSHLVLEDLHIRNSAGAGVRMSSGVINGLVSEDNGGPGVFMGNPVPGIGIVVKKHPNNLHAQRNAGGGVVIEGDFDVELSAVIHENTGHGIAWSPATSSDGLRLKLEDCDVSRNTGDGLHLAGSSTAESHCEMAGVTFSHNGGAGVFSTKPVPGVGIVVKKNPGSGADIRNNNAGGLVLEGDCDVEFAGTVSGNTGHGISWSPLAAGDRLTFKAKEGASVHNTGDGLHFSAPGLVDAVCDLAEFSFERNGGDGIHIQFPHPDSYLSILHHQGQLSENGGDGMDIAAGRSGHQGFFDIAMARNAGAGCAKLDGGSNPGIFRDCVVQDNGGPGLNLEGGSWTLERSVIKNNGSHGVVVAAKKHTKTGHVSLLKRTTAVEDNQGHGVRVYPAEADAVCDVVVENSRSTGNTGAGYHIDAGTEAGSGTFRNSVVKGNDGRGLDLVGGTWTVEGSAVDRNGSDGIVVAAKKHTKTGHVSLLKRGSSAERNAGDGVRVYPLEADAECRVVADRSRFAGNSGDGLHVLSDLPGSSIDLEWLDSSSSGNGGSGLLINPIAMDKGLRFRAQGGACDNNGAGGLTVEGDAVESASVRQLSFRGNSSDGARVTGGHWRFEQCTASGNAVGGFRIVQPVADYQSRGSDYAFEDCDALANAFYGLGIYGFDGSVRARADILGGRISRNMTGIEIANSDGISPPVIAGRVHGARIADNTTFGIASEASFWSITDNQIGGNGSSGISVGGDNNHLARNELAGNSLGIFMGGNGNAARENTFSGMAPAGGALQIPYIDNTGANAVAPVQDVVVGVNPLGNVIF